MRNLMHALSLRYEAFRARRTVNALARQLATTSDPLRQRQLTAQLSAAQLYLALTTAPTGAVAVLREPQPIAA